MNAQRKSTELAVGRRLIIKIGSALLVDEAHGAIRSPWLTSLAADVAALRARGQEVLLVSSGAIAVGRRQLGFTAHNLRLEEKQAAAATGMIQLAHAYQEALARHSLTVAQVLLTLSDTEDRSALARGIEDKPPPQTLASWSLLVAIPQHSTRRRRILAPVLRRATVRVLD